MANSVYDHFYTSLCTGSFNAAAVPISVWGLPAGATFSRAAVGSDFDASRISLGATLDMVTGTFLGAPREPNAFYSCPTGIGAPQSSVLSIPQAAGSISKLLITRAAAPYHPLFFVDTATGLPVAAEGFLTVPELLVRL